MNASGTRDAGPAGLVTTGRLHYYRSAVSDGQGASSVHRGIRHRSSLLPKEALLPQSVAELYATAFGDGLSPEPTLCVSAWADTYRFLSNTASSEPGRWRTSRTPYLREIMDCPAQPRLGAAHRRRLRLSAHRQAKGVDRRTVADCAASDVRAALFSAPHRQARRSE